MREPLRIGAVSYLNTKPLVFGLRERLPMSELVFDVPSRLADRLASRDLDIALIPAVEYFRNPDYTIISDACIACRGPVLSVKLFAQVEPSKIRTLALDAGSRTSAAMVQVLLNEHFGVRPELTSLPIGDGLHHAESDAVLLIGDRAIHATDDSFFEVWDLGAAWLNRTELPFVFAMWTARPGIKLSASGWSEVDNALGQARDDGLANLNEIACVEAEAVCMTPEATLAYLRDNLHFRMGPWERRGLEKFYQDATTLGLVPVDRELRFYDCQTT